MGSRGRVGMVCLIVAEASLFAVFVVAYLYDLGKSLGGPSPGEVLSVPILGTVCLLSSSVTVALAVRALGRGAVQRSGAWLLATVLLAAVFLTGTAAEWLRLITREGVTIGTNLFGTTFYALVGFEEAWLFLAMAQRRLGHGDEARQELARFEKWLAASPPALWPDQRAVDALQRTGTWRFRP